jgi:hypothetical protein
MREQTVSVHNLLPNLHEQPGLLAALNTGPGTHERVTAPARLSNQGGQTCPEPTHGWVVVTRSRYEQS